jgi:hypothetical protein
MELETLKKRYEVLPKKMIVLEARVPMMVVDPVDRSKKIRDPHGRYIQTRVDVVDAEDPFKKPIIHFHKYPDHPTYESHWKEYAEAFARAREDVEFLISEIERLMGGN